LERTTLGYHKADFPTTRKEPFMWAGSLGLVAALIVIVGLAIALAVIIAAPILAVPFFIVGFGAFLLWRGKRRSDVALSQRHENRVPRTEETAGDPVADSSVPDAARTSTDAQTRHPAA
jgi:ABC-type xylose transport system permease subunit